METSSGRINRQQWPQSLPLVRDDTLPYTIQRLRALQQGKAMVYYKGDFETDIAACNRTSHNRGVPRYEALLRSIHGVARDLATQGKVILLERASSCNVRTKKGKVVVHYTEYVAIGNAP